MKALMRWGLVAVCCVAVPVVSAASSAADVDSATPEPLVSAYESLADTILAAKRTEWNLVHSILATTYGHAEGVMRAAERKLEAGQPARAEIETLAALVTQLGNEGDAAVAAVRKRLVEGGHHHNAAGEKSGAYDEGFVVVTRAAKKKMLDAGKAIGRLGRSADVAGLRAVWSAVEMEYRAMCEAAGR